MAAVVFLAGAVLAFSGAWRHGALTFDGRGQSMYLRVALDQMRTWGHLTYWTPDMWAGSPTWAIAASLPVYAVLPLVATIGPDATVKLTCLASQIIGAWGAFVLARTLWGRSPAAVAAGLFYGLAPLFVTHALFGVDRAAMVIAVTPWVVWSARHAFRATSRRSVARYVVLTSVLSAFALLAQAEQAYALVLLCGFLVVVELAGARHADPPRTGAVLARALAISALTLGLIAHWLLPFLSLSDSFILSPQSIVRETLLHGLGGDLAREPGAFLTRSHGLAGAVGFPFEFLENGVFYLGALCLAVTAMTVALLPRHDDDGYLTTILLVSALSVWLSTGAVPLGSSALAHRRGFLPLAVTGALSGLLVGKFLRHLRLGRWAVVGAVGAAAFLIGVPYFTPFLTLQRVVPFLNTIRFSRFYNGAILGLALGAAYPIVVVEHWARRRTPRVASFVAAAAALSLAGAFLIDIHPYRTYYRVTAPPRQRAYDRLSARLDQAGGQPRVASASWGDPGAVDYLSRIAVDQTAGWPHPVANRHVWELTGGVLGALKGHRDAALGLSGTTHVAYEVPVETGDWKEVDKVELEPNPQVLPKVRAYEHVVAVGDENLAPELAIGLAQRNIGVVAQDGRTERDLGSARDGVVAGAHPCRAVAETTEDRRLAGDVAAACSLDEWVTPGDADLREHVDVKDGPAGALFQSPLAGLRGISLWLSRGAGNSELVLYELSAEGPLLGREVARTRASAIDDHDMTVFRFDPIEGSAGARYVFRLECPDCRDFPEMTIWQGRTVPGNLVVGQHIDRKSTTAFSLEYDRLPPVEPPSTRLHATNPEPGHWKVESEGTRPALVVVSEAYFPGWQARVDGKRAPVRRADGAFLGVVVPPGRHVVDLAYHRPAIALLARAISLLTVALVAVVLVPRHTVRLRRDRHRSRRTRRTGDTQARSGASERRRLAR